MRDIVYEERVRKEVDILEMLQSGQVDVKKVEEYLKIVNEETNIEDPNEMIGGCVEDFDFENTS